MNSNNLNINDYYSTSDLGLAAAISLSYPLEAIDRQNPYKAQFLFRRDKHIDQLIESYWRGEMKISPQAYFNQLKVIKSRLYEDRSNLRKEVV